jgi:hypothetical protein
MADSSLMPALIGLGGTFLGAIITLGGTLITQFISDPRKQAQERRRRREDKLEELVSTLHEYDDWIRQVENIRVFGPNEPIPISPFGRVQAVTRVFFPELVPHIRKLFISVRQYENLMIEKWKQRLATGKPNNDGLLDVYNPYIDNFNSALTEITKYSERQFQ